MSKKSLDIFSGVTILGTLIAFFVWAYFEQNENGKIYLEGNENIALIFLLLGIVGSVTGFISLRSMNDEGETISKKTVISGITIAVIFMLWRLSVTI